MLKQVGWVKNQEKDFTLMNADYQNIKLEQTENAVWMLTLNRPEALNALNSLMLNEIGDALRQLSEMDYDNAKVLIITGSGAKAFVAGADIKEMKDLNSDQAQAFSQKGQSVFQELNLLKIPVIAAVNGFALGGGFELALACDFIIASENAKFGLPEVSLGLIPGFGGTVRLLNAVGIRKARELTFTGELITATEAKALGLVSTVVTGLELIPTVMKKVELILQKSPMAVGYSKKSINQVNSLEVEKALTNEAEIFGQIFDSVDSKEGMSAFLEKRKPQFKGS
jgi:enoyl-CoA hydratase